MKGILATKLDLFVDDDYWKEIREAGQEKDQSPRPDGEGLLSFILQIVRPGSDSVVKSEEEAFARWMEDKNMYTCISGYGKNGKLKGIVQIFDHTEETLDIFEISKMIAVFSMSHRDKNHDICFLCRSIADNTILPRSMDIIPLKARMLNFLEAGGTEVVEAKGRVVIINLNFPNGVY